MNPMKSYQFFNRRCDAAYFIIQINQNNLVPSHTSYVFNRETKFQVILQTNLFWQFEMTVLKFRI